jgi:chemotaxis protein CheD
MNNHSPIIVGISDYKISREPDTLVTYALGSCVGICIYDERIGFGGLAHIMLPDSKAFAHQEINRMKFADTAIVDMVQAMRSRGSDVRRMTAKIAGGAKMFEVQQNSPLGTIGQRNLESVRQVLRSLRIPIIAEDVGSNYGRTLYFNLSNGIMKIQSLSRSVKEY